MISACDPIPRAILVLLDYLAWKFMESGWSIKAMHRLLMLSRVYQQSSDDHRRHETRDPDNRLLSKWNRRRLDFEAMRDTLLFVTGKLDAAIGGRPVALQSQDPANPNAYSKRRAVLRNDRSQRHAFVAWVF